MLEFKWNKMRYSFMLLFQKIVDKSLLLHGIAIPVAHKDLLLKKLGFEIKPGETRDIFVEIDGIRYDVTIINVNYNRTRHPNRQDMIQIRYNENSQIARLFNQKFHYTKKLIESNQSVYSAHWLSKLPESEVEHIVIYSNGEENVLNMECISNLEYCEEADEMISLGEFAAESIFNAVDDNASIKLATKECKIRSYTRKICEHLKEKYDYCCQICGEKIGEKYNSNLIHAHHIDYFVNSKNNNADNIMILCPNHHFLIHDLNPIFDRNKKAYIFPNGYVEYLKLNKHL